MARQAATTDDPGGVTLRYASDATFKGGPDKHAAETIGRSQPMAVVRKQLPQLRPIRLLSRCCISLIVAL